MASQLVEEDIPKIEFSKDEENCHRHIEADRIPAEQPDGSSPQKTTVHHPVTLAQKIDQGRAKLEFHTYVGVSTDEVDEDPEGLIASERLNVEEKAIAFIIRAEPDLKRTPPNNPGFDLFDGISLDAPIRFVEIKSKSGPWDKGPVALSVEQFRKAAKEGNRYWLYIVENVADPSATKLHRIQNPVGKARHFTFDQGWADVSEDVQRNV